MHGVRAGVVGVGAGERREVDGRHERAAHAADALNKEAVDERVAQPLHRGALEPPQLGVVDAVAELRPADDRAGADEAHEDGDAAHRVRGAQHLGAPLEELRRGVAHLVHRAPCAHPAG